MTLECPRCDYKTESGKDFMNHLEKEHPKDAKDIFLKLLREGKIEIEVA